MYNPSTVETGEQDSILLWHHIVQTIWPCSRNLYKIAILFAHFYGISILPGPDVMLMEGFDCKRFVAFLYVLAHIKHER